jgi:hypothetical protein
MDLQRVDVTTASRSYAISLADGLLVRAAKLMDDAGAPARRFIVSSPLVWRLHGQRLQSAVPGAEPILVPDG